MLTKMSLAANRPVNWNVLFVGKGSEPITDHNLAASDYADRARRSRASR